MILAFVFAVDALFVFKLHGEAKIVVQQAPFVAVEVIHEVNE